MICTQQEIIEALNLGEIVGVPTDTVYGIAVKRGFESKIYDLKKRDKSKKLINFIYSPKQIGKVDEFGNEKLNEITNNYWPGNNTLIFKQGGELISYRIPNEKNTINLLKSFNDILLTTSANLSGDNPCLTIEEFEKRFPNIKLLKEEEEFKKINRPSNIYIINKKDIKKIR